MSLASLINKFIFGKSSDDPQPKDDFIKFDRSGKAHFDLAGYLASEEGAKRLARIADANQRSARNLDEAA